MDSTSLKPTVPKRSVVKEGFLKKLTRNSFFHRWQDRYFLLDQTRGLCYAHNASEIHTHPRIFELTNIKINRERSSSLSIRENIPYIYIECDNDKPLLLQAQTILERDAWIYSINDTIKLYLQEHTSNLFTSSSNVSSLPPPPPPPPPLQSVPSASSFFKGLSILKSKLNSETQTNYDRDSSHQTFRRNSSHIQSPKSNYMSNRTSTNVPSINSNTNNKKTSPFFIDSPSRDSYDTYLSIINSNKMSFCNESPRNEMIDDTNKNMYVSSAVNMSSSNKLQNRHSIPQLNTITHQSSYHQHRQQQQQQQQQRQQLNHTPLQSIHNTTSLKTSLSNTMDNYLTTDNIVNTNIDIESTNDETTTLQDYISQYPIKLGYKSINHLNQTIQSMTTPRIENTNSKNENNKLKQNNINNHLSLSSSNHNSPLLQEQETTSHMNTKSSYSMFPSNMNMKRCSSGTSLDSTSDIVIHKYHHSNQSIQNPSMNPNDSLTKESLTTNTNMINTQKSIKMNSELIHKDIQTSMTPLSNSKKSSSSFSHSPLSFESNKICINTSNTNINNNNNNNINYTNTNNNNTNNNNNNTNNNTYNNNNTNNNYNTNNMSSHLSLPISTSLAEIVQTNEDIYPIHNSIDTTNPNEQYRKQSTSTSITSNYNKKNTYNPINPSYVNTNSISPLNSPTYQSNTQNSESPIDETLDILQTYNQQELIDSLPSLTVDIHLFDEILHTTTDLLVVSQNMQKSIDKFNKYEQDIISSYETLEYP